MASEKQLTAWIRQRRSFLLNCSREITKSKEYLSPESNISTELIQTSLIVLRDYRAKIEKLDSDILLHIENADEADSDVEAAAEYDYQLLQHISSLTTRLETNLSVSVAATSVSTAGRPESPGGSESQHSNSSHRYGAVKLPKLELSKFNGDPLTWAEFWDSFSTTIHENNSLSDVDKFKYLQGFLDGDALGVVAGYQLTSANYSQAVSALSERFGNKQLAVFSHFESMLALPTASHDIKQLQKIHDSCEKHIRSLVALGLEETTFGQVFTPIILSKLPVSVKMEIHRRNGSKPWELSNLREYLKDEIRARDYSIRTFGGKSSNGDGGKQRNNTDTRGNQHNNHKPIHRQSGHSRSTSDAFVIQEQSKGRCVFCSEPHYSDQCKKFPDVESRKSCLKGRCFNCLSNRHSIKDCSSERVCVYCSKRGHHRSFCFNKFASSSPSSKPSGEASLNLSSNAGVECDTGLSTANSSLLSHGETTILQTALGTVRGNGSVCQARLLFDTGCSRSFVTTELSQKMNARHIGEESTSIAGFADTKRKAVTYKTVKFDVLLPDGGKRTITANVIPTISCPIRKMPLDINSYPTVRQLQLAEPLISKPEQVTIDILLGSDFYYDFVLSERINFPNGMILLSSVLGYIATGKVPDTQATNTGATSLFCSTVDAHPKSTFQIEKFWSLEDIGVKTPDLTNDDEQVLVDFNKTIRFENGRYQVKFPWKKEQKELPENYHLAAGRLRSLLKRIVPQKEVVEKYDQTIQDQLSKGVIEVAPENHTGDRVHYIPHHCVITPNKTTTKLRVVYDASAKASKTAPSLNDCLHRGPVILDDLCSIIIKFRLHVVGLVSDIEKAFLQIGLQESERDATRFLWVKDLTKGPVGDNMIVYRFCRVLFGAISSPFLLGGTVKYHIDQSKSPVASSLEGHVYVDNIINGKPTTDEAIEFYHGAKKLFDEASMNLREWFTNSPEMTEVIKPEDRGKSVETKVLGLNWNTSEDTLNCVSFDAQGEIVNTKRQMLKYLAKVFDPCGYFSAVTVSGKLLIQQLWQKKFDWDDPVTSEIVSEWKKCSESLQQIGSCKLARCYDKNIGSPGAKYSLHCFCDASGRAYAAVVYLVVSTDVSVSSNIVFAKSRIGPVKKISIPRMELMAATVGIRILTFVKTALGLPVANQYLWSDSQCVLQWLVKESVDTVFVRNRVAEITSHRDVEFRYVPTSINPADLSSRGCPFEKIVNNDLWWHGPPWLVGESSQWPKNSINSILTTEGHSSSEKLSEVEVTVEQETVVHVVNSVVDCCMDRSRFSSLKRLLRVTAWVKRFIYNCRHRSKHSGALTAHEIVEAKQFWDHRVQYEHFGDVFENKNDVKTKNLVRQLGVFVDKGGLLRSGGRIHTSVASFDTKHPKLLPKRDHYTDLVIADFHEKLCHSGDSHTLSRIRQEYWIIQGRSQVKIVRKRCHICTFIHGGPYKYPDPPPLPEFRVTRQKPFATVGVDYLGPLFIKCKSGTSQKVWICLFTCGVTRAVHLEVVEDLTAYQFVLCLRRLIAKQGVPRIIVSDNAKHFHKTNKHLSQIWKEVQISPLVHDFSVGQGITWKFITELSPWMGGFYERMVGIVKNCLKKTLLNKFISLVDLQTIVSEISEIVNSRPLLYVGSDPDHPSLTPSHFLGGPNSSLPSVDIPTDDYSPKPTNSNDLINLWRHTSTFLDNFWRCWQNEYLLGVRERGFSKAQRNTSNAKPAIGEVVIVKDNLLRKHWRLGRIIELPLSHDNISRSAVVKLANGNNINRPLRLLYPLEVGTSVIGDRSEEKPTVLDEPKLRRKAFTDSIKKTKNVFDTESVNGSDEK